MAPSESSAIATKLNRYHKKYFIIFVISILFLAIYILFLRTVIFHFRSFSALHGQHLSSSPSTVAFTKVSSDDDGSLIAERGLIHPLLHRQGLCHYLFHGTYLEELLASKLGESADRSILIIGAEWGNDVKHFAKIGYRVIAFEPLSTFHNLLKAYFLKSPSAGPDGNRANVSLFNLAAGHKSGTSLITYQGNQQKVPVVLIDDKVHEAISILKVEVQGNELEVLLGARKLIRTSLQMIWVEVFACHSKLLALLQMLEHEDFILFDIPPFGRPRDQDPSIEPLQRSNFLFYPERPGKLKDYADWLCMVQSANYSMLQTNFVAIKRTLHPVVTSRLYNLGYEACERDSSHCLLRNYLQLES